MQGWVKGNPSGQHPKPKARIAASITSSLNFVHAKLIWALSTRNAVLGILKKKFR
jgi:hypothetical protein